MEEQKKLLIWDIISTVGMAFIMYIAIQFARPHIVEMFKIMSEGEIGTGFIAWTNPHLRDDIYSAPTFYRFMHNLTIPYVMAFYVFVFTLVFLLLRKGTLSKEKRSIICAICVICHGIFMGCYTLACFLPMGIFSQSIG